MSAKRQAPESWDTGTTGTQCPLPKAPRLETEENLTIIEDPPSAFAEDQSLFDDAMMQQLMRDIDQNLDEPPLSVLRDFHSGVSHLETFDPNLKFSPVKEGEDTFLIPDNEPPSEDINWDEIVHFKGTPQDDISPNTSFAKPEALRLSIAKPPSTSTTAWTSGTMENTPQLQGMHLDPQRTHFRLRELVKSKCSTAGDSDDEVLEVFARVVYSARENFGHKQYFLFRDLLEDKPPYLSGTLSG